MQDKQAGGVTRRDFLKAAAVIGGMALTPPFVLKSATWASDQLGQLAPVSHGTGTSFETYGAGDVIYTICEQCNAHCTIRALLDPSADRGPALVRKMAGNPYSPLNTVPFGTIDYETSVDHATAGQGDLAKQGRSLRGGRTCLKGQAGIQTAYDAYRVRTPLKRVGPRGSGKWKSISWEQALDEIVNGASDLGTPGLKQLWAYVPEKQVMGDWQKVNKGILAKEAFDEKYKDVLVDTDHPEFGPKANQIVNLGGDRRDFVHTRIWNQGIGSVNAVHHGGICGISGVFGNLRSFNPKKKKKRLYADLDHCDFLIVWGSNPVVANKGPTWLAPMLTNALQRGMKMAVVDPRLSKTAEKADWWVPVKPGTDGTLALGMARWILENTRYDRQYLTNPNRSAAEADGEPTWSDATYLVRMDLPGKPKLRASDLGIGGKDEFVVVVDGQPTPHSKALDADLEVDTTIHGMRVKSVFTLFKEKVFERTLQEYAAICDISPTLIETLALQFTDHGKRAAILAYRGPAMHANGYYGVRAINALNHLIGNHDWKGGSITTGAKYNEYAGRYDVLKVPQANQAWGLPLVRNKAKYEESTFFKRDGYPAKRPWFPFSAHITHEVLPSAAEGYPYSIEALLIHRISPVMSVPGGRYQEAILKDPKKIPLLVVYDVALGETAACADYVLPDLTYLERWGLEHIYPNIKRRLSSVMQPVTRVFDGPRSVEDVYIDLLKRMELPGVGNNAFPDGRSLDRAEDFYLKIVANMAYDQTPVPDADDIEMKQFLAARRKGLGANFDETVWRQAVKPEEWRKVVYVLNRGGRFEASGSEYEGDILKYRLGDLAVFYDEAVAKGRHSYTGEYFDGLPHYEPVRKTDGHVLDPTGPLMLINWKARHIGTHRNIASAWLREIRSENPVWMNPQDARKRGLKSGDRVMIAGDTFETEGTVWVTRAIRPGVVGASYNFGHTAYGSRSVSIGGKRMAPVKAYGHTSFRFRSPGHEETGFAGGRGEGFSLNELVPVDPEINMASLSDPIGGAAAEFDAWVEVRRA